MFLMIKEYDNEKHSGNKSERHTDKGKYTLFLFTALKF